MSAKKLMVLGMIMLLVGQIAVFAQDYNYFRIKDLEHGAYLAAGHKYDGDLYHLKKNAQGKLPQTAQWRFEEAGKVGGKQYYYIVDRLHDSAIMAGDNYDGDTYSQKNYSGKHFAMWTAKEETLEQGQIPVIFTDRKHKLDLVAGSRLDGEIYHQKAGQRSNARWVLELVEKDTKGKKGPDFYVAEQRLVSLKFDTDVVAAIKNPPTLTLDNSVPNYSDVTQSTTTSKLVEHTAEEYWEFTRAVKVSLYQELSVSGGLAGTQVESKTTIGVEVDHEWVRRDTRKTKNALTWSIPVVVPPHSRVSVSAVIKVLKRDVNFTATIENIMGSGEKKIITVDGTWIGVEYVTGEIRFDQTKL